MSLTTYLGPYLLVPSDSEFRKGDWESVVVDGRAELGVGEDHIALIPNQKLPKIDRHLQLDDIQSDTKISLISISPAMIVRETSAFILLADPVIQWCDDHGIEVKHGWGVVLGWW